MDPTQRAQLVDRIVTTWPHGPKGAIWTETLTDHPELTFGEALDVYKHLRDTVERNPPTVAVFLATWRARHQHPADDLVQAQVDGPPMSLAEYLSALTWRASTGDTDAAQMLDEWGENLQRMPTQRWQP
jgi:hypothetical protein